MSRTAYTAGVKVGFPQSGYAASLVLGPANPSLPRYEILEKMGATIEVLVTSLRPSGQPDNFSRHLLEITRREGAAVAHFYSTREAYDANVNGGTNPRTIDRAMKRGYLRSC